MSSVISSVVVVPALVKLLLSVLVRDIHSEVPLADFFVASLRTTTYDCGSVVVVGPDGLAPVAVVTVVVVPLQVQVLSFLQDANDATATIAIKLLFDCSCL